MFFIKKEDFLYEIGEEPYVAKEIDSRTLSKGIGQIYNSYAPGTNIYNDIYYKFYYEWKSEFRRLARVSWTCIEANPGAVFQIQDGTDDPSTSAEKMYHEINQGISVSYVNRCSSHVVTKIFLGFLAAGRFLRTRATGFCLLECRICLDLLKFR